MPSLVHTTRLATVPALALVVGFAAVGAAARLLPDGGGLRVRAAQATPKQETFTITGRVVRPLRPGSSGALNLRLTNRHRYSLRITRLAVSLRVDAAHVRAGCDRTANYRIRRLTSEQYPIRLRPNRTRSLYQLKVSPVPRVIMRNIPFNQDACKGAVLRLRFAGHAHRWDAARR